MAGREREIERRQKQVLEEMKQITVMRRGTLSRQHYAKRQKRKGGQGASGPYFLWQGYVQGKRFGMRVNAEQAPAFEREIAARRRFEQLCAEYIALGETLAEEQRQHQVTAEEVKKGLKSRSNRVRKSPS